jgi:trigger factor
MKLKNVDNPEKNVFVLEIEVEKDEFSAAVDRAFKKNSARINVPGFRKGKAPRSIVEKMYGPEIFYDDAINEVCPQAFQQAVEEKGIIPVEKPEMDIKEISSEGLTFTAKFYVKPEFTVENYKGISAPMETVNVSDEDIDTEIENRRQKSARIVSVERAIQDGDTALIDYEGSVDSVPFDGGKDEGYSLKIGSGTFIPGFEEQLIGKTAGEECDVNVTFPEQYHSQDLAGKAAVFKVKVHEVRETVLPELDDEFAKDVSEFDTLEELRADIKKNITQTRETAAKAAFYEQVIDKICEGVEEEVPAPMVESQIDGIVRDFSYRLSSQGMTIDNYLTLTGTEMDDFRANFREQALRNVKARLVLEGIARAEGITVSDEDVEKEYNTISEGYKMPVEEIKKYFDSESIKEDLLVSKAADIVRETAIAEELPAEDDKAEKKEAKPKAKKSAKKDETEEAETKE